MNDDEKFLKIKAYALRLLSIRPRSMKELEDRLSAYTSKHTMNREVIGKLLHYLQEVELVSDEHFAGWWIEQRQGFKPKGMQAIRLELIKKGISKDIIDSQMVELHISSDTEFASAFSFAQKKYSYIKSESIEKQKRYLQGILLRRGFGWNTVSRVIDCLLKKTYNRE